MQRYNLHVGLGITTKIHYKTIKMQVMRGIGKHIAFGGVLLKRKRQGSQPCSRREYDIDQCSCTGGCLSFVNTPPPPFATPPHYVDNVSKSPRDKFYLFLIFDPENLLEHVNMKTHSTSICLLK